jgi:hypothetical protein
VWYRERWGTSFKIASDQNAKTRYDNDKGGYRIATSVQGLGTGEGGDRIVVDDPHNVLQAESQAVREGTITWWDETMSTRGNDPKTVARIIVMQRVHFADLTGHCLEKGGYDAPVPAGRVGAVEGAVCTDEAREVRGLAQEAGRTALARTLRPDELAKLKSKLGTYGAAAQLQQTPIPEGGGLFKLNWFPRYNIAPRTA